MVEGESLVRIGVEGGIDEVGEARLGHVLEHVDDADGAAALGEGVRGSRGRLVDGEHAADGVELVGHGDGPRDEALRELVAGEARAVVLGHGAGDLVGLTGRLGVVAAHDALLARELHDGLGDEVGLGEVRGAAGVVPLLLGAAGLGDHRGGEGHHAGGLLAHGAEALLEGHGLEPGQVVLEGVFEVLLEEKLGVVEAGAHHALVAVHHGLGAGRVAVAHDDEGPGEVAVAVVRGEIALVGQHGLADDLVGDREELLVEAAHQDRGPLAEVDHLVEDAGRGVHGDAELGLHGGDALADAGGALLVAEDAGVLEHGLVGGGLGHDVLAGGQHAVAAGGAAGGDVGVGDVEHLVAEEGADPAHGPAVALVG